MEASGGFQTDWNMNPTICRLCLHSDGFLLGIFNHLHGKEKNIYKKIVDCTALEISSGDGLPHTICHRCLFKLELCLDFRAQCFVSDSTLRQASRIAHAQRASSSNAQTGEQPLSLMDLMPPQSGDSGDVVVVVDPSAVDYDSDYENSKYGRPNSNEHYNDQPPAMAQMAPNIGHYGHMSMMNHTLSDNQTAHDQQIPSDNETNEIADNGGEIYDFRNVFMCRYCDRAFTDKQQCTRHEAEDHDPAEPYSCKTCQLTFPDRLHYSAHLKSLHADDKPYDCPECEKMFARRSDLRKHTIVHTGIKPFTCPVCSKSFSRNTNLSKHMRIHAGHKPFVCPRCPKTFITRGDLQRHSLIHSGRKPFPCRYCNLSFSRRDKLMRHEKRHFPAGVPLENASGRDKAKSGGKNGDYSSENMVIDIDPIYTAAHETSDNNVSVAENRAMSPGQEQRTLLDDTVASVNDALNDSDSRRNEFSSSIDMAMCDNRESYEKGHKKRKRLKSDSIGHVTGDGNELEQEEKDDIERELTPMEKAAKSKRYPCLQCHRRFSNMEGLKFHIQQHHNTSVNTSGRPFPCSQCPKGFIRKRELDRHMTTHSGMKPFSCTSCDKRFGRKDKLVRHMRIHDGSNLHVCPICNLAFSRKDSLWQHMRNHQRQEQQQYQSAPNPSELLNDSSSNITLNDSSSLEHPQTHSEQSQTQIMETKAKESSKGLSLLQEYLEEETLSSSSNFREQFEETNIGNTVNVKPHTDNLLDLDPDFIDTKIEPEESKSVTSDLDRQKDSPIDFEKDKDDNLTIKERSSEIDDEDEDDDEEYDENRQDNSRINDDLNDGKDRGDHQLRYESNNMDNQNVQPNSGDPDYDEDLDLDENDEEMGEEEDDEDGQQNPDGEQQQQQQQQQQQHGGVDDENKDEIIDCDAINDSADEEEEDSNQDGGRVQQKQDGEQQRVEDDRKHDFSAADDDLDEDFDDDNDEDDDDDNVQMIAEPQSVIF